MSRIKLIDIVLTAALIMISPVSVFALIYLFLLDYEPGVIEAVGLSFDPLLKSLLISLLLLVLCLTAFIYLAKEDNKENHKQCT